MKLAALVLTLGLTMPRMASAQQTIALPDSAAADLYLVDTTGRLVSLYDFPGKVVVVDVWFTGCGGCIGFYHEAFRELKQLFRGDDRVVFISLSADREVTQWKESILLGDYTDTDAINVYTGGRKFKHHVFPALGIDRAPSLVLIGPNGDTKRVTGFHNKTCCTAEDFARLISTYFTD